MGGAKRRFSPRSRMSPRRAPRTLRSSKASARPHPIAPQRVSVEGDCPRGTQRQRFRRGRGGNFRQHGEPFRAVDAARRAGFVHELRVLRNRPHPVRRCRHRRVRVRGTAFDDLARALTQLRPAAIQPQDKHVARLTRACAVSGCGSLVAGLRWNGLHRQPTNQRPATDDEQLRSAGIQPRDKHVDRLTRACAVSGCWSLVAGFMCDGLRRRPTNQRPATGNQQLRRRRFSHRTSMMSGWGVRA